MLDKEIREIRKRAGLQEQGELVPRRADITGELADDTAIEDLAEEIRHSLEHLFQVFMYIEDADGVRRNLPHALKTLKEVEAEMLKLKKFVS